MLKTAWINFFRVTEGPNVLEFSLLAGCGDVAGADCDQQQTEPDSSRHGLTVLKVHRNLSVNEGHR